MGWQTDDGRHEGAAVGLCADGALVGSYGPASQVMISEYRDGTRAAYDTDVRSETEVVGWLAWCSCGWRGPTYTRVHAPEREDRARRIVFEESPFEPQWVQDEVHAEWYSHVRPSEAVGEVAEAASAVATATERLDEAVLGAREAGASWAAIGGAAGITRQAAHLRWAARQTVRLSEARERVDS